jgi:hypothetical protein
MTKAHIFALGIALAIISLGGAADAAYPVSGRWTYENASASGPAKSCTGRIMDFLGVTRHDTGGGVSDYRNVSVSQSSPSFFYVVDEFFNVMIRGRVEYTLRILDQHHIEIHVPRGGATFMLRRCA